MHALRFCLLVAPLAFALPTFAQTPSQFPFSLPWNDATQTVISAADLNPAPLTNAHRVSVKNGHFFDTTGRRVRFLGTNLVGSANFSQPGDAILFAGRLHKLGINCVRLHHMDATWANPNIFGENRENGASNAQVSPKSLDLLDATVAQLKKNGVYVDLNLHVAQSPSPGDGFPDADKLPEMGKVVAYFDPQFIALQKEYARQILNHRNPYTGQKWAEDPVVALVELNNEDTLVGQAWSGMLQGLPPRYRTTLQDGWNRFLKARYASTDELRRAWNAPVETGNTLPNVLGNGQFGEGTQGWTLEVHEGAQGEMSVVDVQNAPANGPTGRAVRVQIAQKPDENWKVQLNQTGLNLKANSLYTLGYWIRADKARPANAYFALDQEPWSGVGGRRDLSLSPEWQYVRVVFKTGATVPNHSRLSFALGDTTDAVEIADVRLTEGAQAQLPTSQTIEGGTLDLPPAQGSSPGQAHDWVDYLMTIESAYVSTMRDTIRNECGFQGPIACSQASYGGFGGIAREASSEWTDMHAYWQHPEFPGQPWDSKNWRIGNKAMLDDPNGGTLAGLAPYRVEGKPFVVSEYNHPAPNEYASETVPLILSYAAMQDWDGLFLFSWNGDGSNWNPNKIRGFFDMDSDPNKTVLLPLMARAFLGGALSAAPAQTTLSVPQNKLVDLTTQTQEADGSFWDNVTSEWRSRGFGLTDVLNSRVGMRLVPGQGGVQLARSGPRSALSSNPSFNWGFVGGNGRLVVDSPSVKALVGRVAGNFWPLSGLSVENPASSNGWMSLVAVARDGKPLEKSSSIIVGALNRAENANMAWNAERNSVGEGWGSGPTLLETPSATLDLQTGASRVEVWKLDATGKRVAPVVATLQNGHARFSIAPSQQTPWYEIALGVAGAAQPRAAGAISATGAKPSQP